MMRSLYSGVAGLKTHQTRMDVIGNNIANVNTTAYKSSSMTFSELMSQTTQKASGATLPLVSAVPMPSRSVWALRQELSILPLPRRVPRSLPVTPLIS